MQAYSNSLRDYTSQTDAHIRADSSFTNKVQSSLQLASWAVGRFIQIHPFLNGNGRISRLLANYFFIRYDLGIVPFTFIARPGGDYGQAMNVCMTGDFAPLFRYFTLALATSRPVAS
jgi:Fic family protein